MVRSVTGDPSEAESTPRGWHYLAVDRIDSAVSGRVTSVTPDADIVSATTLMEALDYSQLPVMSGDRDVKGIISWNSIGRRVAQGLTGGTVSDYMDEPVVINADTSLLRVMDMVSRHEAVLVRDRTRAIIGIVTITDLGDEFRELTEPFLALAQLEHELREVVSGIPLEQISAYCEREVAGVKDLSFGEYVGLLERKDVWALLGLRWDRKIVVKELELARDTRNKVMHFRSAGPAPDELDRIRNLARMLKCRVRHA